MKSYGRLPSLARMRQGLQRKTLIEFLCLEALHDQFLLVLHFQVRPKICQTSEPMSNIPQLDSDDPSGEASDSKYSLKSPSLALFTCAPSTQCLRREKEVDFADIIISKVMNGSVQSKPRFLEKIMKLLRIRVVHCADSGHGIDCW